MAGHERPGPARWGWHRLTDEWAAELVARAGVRRGDLVVDLGAGTGALTAPLLDAGARVVAVELHPERATALRARFAGRPVTVVRADLAALRLPRQAFTVVANPPFALASALVRRLESTPQLRRADLVVPLHTARRMQGCTAAVSLRLPRSAFVPRPSVDIAVLTICNSSVASQRRRA